MSETTPDLILIHPCHSQVPYEGCGGNCVAKRPTSDCFNDCYASLNATSVGQILDCDFSSTGSAPMCAGMNSLWGQGSWPNTPAARSSFAQYSANTAIDFATGQWQKQTTDGYVNWCSGFNLHFDMAVDAPYWSSITPSASAPPSSSTAGGRDNVMVRYRRTACNPW